ncbi:MAG: gamma-glutamyl-gamma-aminobutyrate hydrolase family protein [Pseudomonadota bacterium]|nr:gamma-glutamyl-gamma-aminobutyrate hydrolase family protein [Pseudomonadota bacterium]
MLKFAIIGEFSPEYEPHLATNSAIEHSLTKLGTKIDHEWVASNDITSETFTQYQGFWIAPGSPYKNMQNVLTIIKHARENNIPLLGTCGGFQHMIIDLAHNMLSFFDAEHGEYSPAGAHLFISRLASSLEGRELPITLAPKSQLARIYATTTTDERYCCNYGVNPAYAEIIKASQMKVVAADAEGEIRAIEHPSHPFFIGTLFVPQMHSTAAQPHPLVTAFMEAVENSGNVAPQAAAAREHEWEL